MVVARKTPLAPAPSSSRSSSSQQPPKPAKSKTPPVSVASSNINGKATVPSKKSKSPLPIEQKRTESSSFKWFMLLLSVFVCYAVSTCPSDIPRTSNFCYSLDLYKTHIIDPYIVPPIETLSHHADPYIAPIKPYASSAAELARTHVVPRASALLDFALEKYNTHVAPQLHWFFVDQYWNGIIKPIYYKGLHPHLEHHSRPYRIYYRRFIVPGIRKATARVNATYIQLRPHVERFLFEARGHTINAYKKTRPYVIEAYHRVRPHAIALVQKAKFYALVLACKAGDARRQYVDPHILRIWEKVSEPSNASSYYETATPKPTQALEDEPTTFSSSTVIKSVIPTPEPPVTTAQSVAEPVPEQEAEPEATIPQEETAAPEPTTTPQPSSSSETDLPLPSAPVNVTPVPPAEHEAESAASVVAASLHAGAAAAQVTPEANSQPEPELEFDSQGLQSAEDVVDFLKDIGISEDDEIVAESVVEEEQVVEEVNTEPERPSYGDPEPSPEERQALIAKKRAQITLRHEKWQADLDALVRENMHAVRTLLSESRGAAVAHLAQWGLNQKGVVAEVENEAGKLLKGLEGYLKGVEEKVSKMNKAGTKQEKEQRDKDREMWNKVVEKVEIRMAEKVRDIHKEVHDWFVGVHEREIQEIDTVSGNVRALASRAQADLGLDYAWLDDVTYYDWQKYHDLMRTSENFTSQAQKIQAQIEPQGTNELIDALNDLEREVDETVEGFNVFIANIRRRAEGDDGVFGTNAYDFEPEKKIKEELGEPEVSILPIEPEKKAVPVPVKNVFMGRAKEEVEAKLIGVPVEDVRAGREEL
ncbi:hypothetical protein H2248_010467 [Termitomyces sp. 'cryptogamus']|nr:hypothetical protein H2248_010467 [Termitomyces sp. 'cryptogamus']